MPAPTALPTGLVAGNTGHVSHSNTVHGMVNIWTSVALQTKTADYTLALADAGEAFQIDSTSARVVTVPTNAVVAFAVGTFIGPIIRYNTGTLTIVGAGVTLRTPSSLTARVQYSGINLLKIGTDEWLVSGDLT